MRAAIKSQLASGQTTLYGRRLTYHRLWECGIPAVRDRMFEILRSIDLYGIPERPFALQKTPRGMFSVPGINFVISVDGHHKLSEFGIEIYAGIDVYSRYIMRVTLI
jgi:hypothetical protein